MTDRARLLIVALLSALMLLPGLAALPVTDRDEARFVQSSRQMVASGDPVQIRFHDEARLKKPIGIYWAQSLAATLSGQGAEAPLWVFRLPSLIGMTAAAVLIAWLAAPLVGPLPAAAAALLSVAGIVSGVEGRIATTDAALLATVMAMQGVLARLWLGQSARWMAWLFWLACGASILIKGPIGPMIAALTAITAVVLRRDAGWLRPLRASWPVIIAAALTLPWFVAITYLIDGAFWTASVGEDLLAKAQAGQEGKGARPGTYLAIFWLAFWPGAVLVLLMLRCIWAARRDPAILFLAAWAIPGWLVFEAAPTKLIHYPMPLWPALALAAAMLWLRGAPVGRTLRSMASLLMLAGPLLLAAVVWLGRDLGGGWWPGAGFYLAGLVLAVLAIRAIWTDARPALLAALVASGAVVTSGIVLSTSAMPGLWPSHLAVQKAQAISGCKHPQIIGWGYQEPSLVWLAGTANTLLVAGEAPLPPLGDCAVVIRDSRAIQPVPPGLHHADSFSAYALGAGRTVDLSLFVRGE